MLDRGKKKKKKIPTEDELDASRGQKERKKEISLRFRAIFTVSTPPPSSLLQWSVPISV